MRIQSQKELEVTRKKLKLLEEHLKQSELEPVENELHRNLSLRSIQRWINRLKEQIVRYESHAKTVSE